MSVESLLPADSWLTGATAPSAIVNDNARRLEVALLPALSFEATQPGSPVDGALYILSADWGAGVEHDLAYYFDGAWTYWTPFEGQVKDVGGSSYQFDGAAWVPYTPGAGSITLTGDVTGSGTGTFATTLATAQPAVHTWALAQTHTVAPVVPGITGNAGSSSLNVSQPTSDGSDTARSALMGASAMNNTRGAWVEVSGNEHASTPGLARVAAGAGADIELNTSGAGYAKLTQAPAAADSSLKVASTGYVQGEFAARNTSTALATSGSVGVDCALGDYFTLALAGNVSTFTFSNLPGSGKGTTKMIRITQDSSPRTVGWPASFKWAGGTAGVVSTGSGAVDVLAITTFDNGTTWNATLAKAFA